MLSAYQAGDPLTGTTWRLSLRKKVARRTVRAHRPRNIVAGTRIQPTDDTVEEEGDEEESDEDLDDM